jgi:hypothetical protein
MLKRLVPAFIVLGLVGLLVYQLFSQAAAECTVCVVFKERRSCATVGGPSKAVATEEAHRSACDRLARGVTESFACPKIPAESVKCKE